MALEKTLTQEQHRQLRLWGLKGSSVGRPGLGLSPWAAGPHLTLAVQGCGAQGLWTQSLALEAGFWSQAGSVGQIFANFSASLSSVSPQGDPVRDTVISGLLTLNATGLWGWVTCGGDCPVYCDIEQPPDLHPWKPGATSPQKEITNTRSCVMPTLKNPWAVPV